MNSIYLNMISEFPTLGGRTHCMREHYFDCIDTPSKVLFTKDQGKTSHNEPRKPPGCTLLTRPYLAPTFIIHSASQSASEISDSLVYSQTRIVTLACRHTVAEQHQDTENRYLQLTLSNVAQHQGWRQWRRHWPSRSTLRL